MKHKIKSLLTAIGGFIFLSVIFQNCGQNPNFYLVSETASPPLNQTLGDTTIPMLKVEKDIILSETLKTDVLFVIDNSGSMALEQASMSQKFLSLVGKLNAVNWKVGIITTDATTDPNMKYNDGKLLYFPNGKTYIDSSLPLSSVQTYFSQTIQRPEIGDGWEQGIATTFRFVARDLASTEPFLRPDSSMNIVYISDADESVGFNGPRNDPTNLFNYLNSVYPTKKIQFHSIVVRTGDVACLALSQNESYGTSYEILSTLSGGVIGNICADDYGGQLTFISEKIKDQIKTVELDCAPALSPRRTSLFKMIDENQNILEIEKIQGTTVYLKNDLPVGKLKMEYYCLKETSL